MMALGEWVAGPDLVNRWVDYPWAKDYRMCLGYYHWDYIHKDNAHKDINSFCQKCGDMIIARAKK